MSINKVSGDSNFASGAVRSSDANHLDFASLPLIGLIAVARTAAEGAAKYGRLNYMQGMPSHGLLNHSVRHIVLHLLGDRNEPHLPHAAWGLLAAIQSETLEPSLSRPHILGPGAWLTPENIEHLDANKDTLAARRAAGDFAGIAKWSVGRIPEVAQILDDREEHEYLFGPDSETEANPSGPREDGDPSIPSDLVQDMMGFLAHDGNTDPEILAFAAETTPEPYGAVTVNEYGQPRLGDWIQTYTGVKFHPLDVRDEDLVIEDIAHALSLVNRFTGHTKWAYSVAEHCVRCSFLMPDDRPDLCLEALLHDASEAYIADIARPVKMLPQMAPYREMEAGIEAAICRKWNLPRPMSREVKRADEVMLRTEARDLFGSPPKDWIFREEPLDYEISPWDADEAKRRFMDAYRFYQANIKAKGL